MVDVYDIKTHLFLGATVRLCLLFYGDWQDRNMDLKYTDIDYHVFTDAARYVYQGFSPYTRPTYRYTPFLAWMLTPNIFLHPSWGKCLFIIFDLVIGYLLYKILRQSGHNKKQSALAAAQWLFNPLTITISTRGSAESVVCSMVLFTLYYFQKRQSFLVGIFCGLAIHFKLYAVTYCMPIYFSYGEKMHQALRYYFWPNRQRLEFVFGVLISVVGLTGLAYLLYRNEFLHEAILYHLSRKDCKHNFSVYFYSNYLSFDKVPTILTTLLGFLPQLMLHLFFSFKFHRPQFIPFSLFCNTYLFVTFNKVLTSQYYIWYLCLLPLVTAKLHLSIGKTLMLILIWIVPQAMWLSSAYNLEFMGNNTFFEIWSNSILLFISHVALLCIIIRLKFENTK